MTDLKTQFKPVKIASRALVRLETDVTNQVLKDLSKALIDRSAEIISANQKDLARMDAADPKYDRLKLTSDRIASIANDVSNVAALPTPLNLELEKRTLESGLRLTKMSVPLGVIGIIYEARPNVTVDAFALAFKSGNACILKGGSDAADSNQAITEVIKAVLNANNVDSNCVMLMPPERETVQVLLDADEIVDVIIPRGSQGLINFVRENAKVPVIETGAGICHTYIDGSADTEKAKNIVYNAKTKRPSVCNALDCMVIHRDKLSDLPEIVADLAQAEVELFADEDAYSVLEGKYPKELLQPATQQSFGTEFLSLKASIKTVPDFETALDHIAAYSSGHSEAIIAEDESVIDDYLKRVDAAAVYSNASTYFTDGAQFGLGAEIGISTQKLHARGPMGLREMTSYKWVLRGDGQIRM